MEVKTIMKGFDHIRVGKYFVRFIYPPFILPETSGFKDSLKDIIPLKLEELLKRCNELKKQKEIRLKEILARTQKDSVEQYIRASIIFHQFSEFYVIQKWVNYWLRLWYEVTDQPLTKKLTIQFNHINAEDIEKAKQTPLESLYDGRLRRIGSRLVGLCPFHQEKTPSFNIYLNDNSFHCYGCQVHGDPISFIQNIRNWTFPEAVRSLI